MKRCKCEHWETCQVCYPQGFDEHGHRKPVEVPQSREELLSRIKDLEADAARLVWLIKKQRIIIEDRDGKFFTYNSISGKEGVSAGTPKEAIDAALKGEQK